MPAVGRSSISSTRSLARMSARAAGVPGSGDPDDDQLRRLAQQANPHADPAKLLPHFGLKRIGIVAGNELRMLVAVLVQHVDHRFHGAVEQLLVRHAFQRAGLDFGQAPAPRSGRRDSARRARSRRTTRPEPTSRIKRLRCGMSERRRRRLRELLPLNLSPAEPPVYAVGRRNAEAEPCDWSAPRRRQRPGAVYQ